MSEQGQKTQKTEPVQISPGVYAFRMTKARQGRLALGLLKDAMLSAILTDDQSVVDAIWGRSRMALTSDLNSADPGIDVDQIELNQLYWELTKQTRKLAGKVYLHRTNGKQAEAELLAKASAVAKVLEANNVDTKTICGANGPVSWLKAWAPEIKVDSQRELFKLVTVYESTLPD
jgi:hypothetical protein